jgi:hypothetical protein
LEQPHEGKQSNHEGGATSDQNAVDGAEQEDQVMSKLPRTRPQRRSGRRQASQGRRAPASARGGSGSSGRRRPPQTRSQQRPRAAARSEPAEQPSGLPERALGAAVTTAKMPLKVTAALTRRTASLIGRRIRF